MKKFLLTLIILCITLFVGCKKDDTTPNDNPGDGNDPVINTGIPDAHFETNEFLSGKKYQLTIDNYTNNTLLDIEISNPDILILTDATTLQFRAVNFGKTTVTIINKNNKTELKTIDITIFDSTPTFYFSSNHVETGQSITFGMKKSIFSSSDNIGLKEKSLNDFVVTTNNDNVSIKDNVITGLKKGSSQVTFTSKLDSYVTNSYVVEVGSRNEILIMEASTSSSIAIGEDVKISLLGGLDTSLYNFIVSPKENASLNDNHSMYPNTEGYIVVTISEKLHPTNKVNMTFECIGKKDVDYPARVIDMALEEKGTEEVGSNHTKYGVWYNNDGEPWCATFVSWCLYQSGVSQDVMCKFQGCYAGMTWACQKGIMHFIRDFKVLDQTTSEQIYTGVKEDYKPVTGDIIFFLSGGWSHTGLVIYSDETYVYTIEGNHSDRVDCWRWNRDDARITGYAHPNYPQFTGVSKDYSYIVSSKIDGKNYWNDVTFQDSAL